MSNALAAMILAVICSLGSMYYVYIGKDDSPLIVGMCIFVATSLLYVELQSWREKWMEIVQKPNSPLANIVDGQSGM